MDQEINMDDLINILSKVRIRKRGKLKLQVENELLIKLMPSPLFKKSLPVNSDVDCCTHISCVTPDLVWVSDDILSSYLDKHSNR